MPSPLQVLARIVWVLAETWRVSLRRLAPYVFGLMIGHWPHRMNK